MNELNLTDKKPRIARVSPLQVPVNRLFDYWIPDELMGRVQRGNLVVVPFGRRSIFGIVVELREGSEIKEIKPVGGIVDDFKSVPPDLMRMCLWMSQMYICPLHSVMDAAFPFQKRMKAAGIEVGAFTRLQQKTIFYKSVSLLDPAIAMSGENDFEPLKKWPARRRVLKMLAERGGDMPVRELLSEAKTTMETVAALERSGLIAVDFLPRNLSQTPHPAVLEEHLVLTPEQRTAYEAICEALREEAHRVFLLHGVTGSGKTEIYMHAAMCCISRGKKVLILVPEIALGTQIIQRFHRRFGHRLAIWHSALSFAERLYEWHRIAAGAVDIVVGARSAVFVPLENIGLVIIDEEQESAYKQEQQPRYHGRDAAIRRAQYLGCPVVLGSATPSVETYYLASRGKYTNLILNERIGESVLPTIKLVDMRIETRRRSTSTFGALMINEIKANVERGGQTLVFLNHRGYNQFAQCIRCGYTFRCPDCSISMKYHKSASRLKCHICGHSEEPQEKCPECGSRAIRYYGLGTEKVFSQLQRGFPNARIERMDRDTTQKKGEYSRIINACELGEVDILVGTQMIAKGLDFSGVTLVCVVDADSVINLPEFRSSERTFQLLTQVAGRAGRGESPGKVIVQTFSPDHPAIRAAATHDFKTFYDFEIAARRNGRFPPFSYLVNFIISHEDPKTVRDISFRLVEKLNERIVAVDGRKFLAVLGPTEAPFLKLHGKFRWFVAVRGTRLRNVIDICREAHEAQSEIDGRCTAIDVNPLELL